VTVRDQAEGLRKLFYDRLPRLLNVASGRPGTGRTSFVVNLAAELARLGREVIVVDENLGMGNVCDALGLRPRLELSHALHRDRALREVLFPVSEGLHLLPAARGLRMLQQKPERISRQAREDLSRVLASADFVIVDTASGGTAGLLLPVSARREIVITTAVGFEAVTQTYAWIKALPRKYREIEARVAVCKARREDEARLVYSNLAEVAERHLGMRLGYLGIVGHDSEVGQAARAGKTVLETCPGSAAAKHYRAIAARLESSPVPLRPVIVRPRPPQRESARAAA
jgi:flagellar biosynthesis protein FlhG